jgi:hypothetical protein
VFLSSLLQGQIHPFSKNKFIVNNQVEPASVQPTKTLLEESVATTDFIKVEI